MLSSRTRSRAFVASALSIVGLVALNYTPASTGNGPSTAEQVQPSLLSRLSRDGLHAPIVEDPLPGFAPAVNPQVAAGVEASLLIAEGDAPSAAPQNSLDWGYCSPDTQAPNPHRSTWKDPKTGKIPFEASAHGYWKKGSCDKNDLANVNVDLYEWYANPQGMGFWVPKANNSKKIYPDEHKNSEQVVARKACQIAVKTSWLSEVDVDVEGKLDPPTVGSARADNVACRTWA